MKFLDQAKIYIRSGSGGAGSMRWQSLFVFFQLLLFPQPR